MLRRWMAAGLVAVATAGVLNAVPATAQRPYDPTAQSLRALGLRHGLYVGTAVDMAALDDPADPQYREMVATQFSTVTAENVMKWEILEPTRGTYNWAAGRRTRRLRPTQPPEGPRPRAGLAQPAAGLADHWASPTAPSATPNCGRPAPKHITTVVSHYRGRIWQWDVVNEAVSDPWDTPSDPALQGFLGRAPRSRLHRRRVPLGPRRRPERPAVLQRLQHRGVRLRRPDDKTQFVYDMVKQLLGPGRADRRGRQPGPPGHPVRQLRHPRRSPPRCTGSPGSGSPPRSPRSTCAAR